MSTSRLDYAEQHGEVHVKSVNNADDEHPLALVRFSELKKERLVFEALSCDLEGLARRGAEAQPLLPCEGSDEGESLIVGLLKAIGVCVEEVDAHLVLISEAE